MRLYRYWVRQEASVQDSEGTPLKLTVFGYANESEAAASLCAARQVELIQARICGERDAALEESYEAPIREEVFRELSPTDIVSCNRYGALVLNTSSVVFVDVDFAGYRVPRQLSFWQRLFTSRLYRPATPEEATEQVFATAERVLKDSYCRIYRTCKGLRLLIVEDAFKPGTPEFQRLMKVFQADRLYARLCVKQECCRARLTPKPTRIQIRPLKHVWPRSEAEEQEVQQWRADYVERCKEVAVCKFLGEVGKNPGRFLDIINFHDEMTKALAELPLA